MLLMCIFTLTLVWSSVIRTSQYQDSCPTLISYWCSGHCQIAIRSFVSSTHISYHRYPIILESCWPKWLDGNAWDSFAAVSLWCLVSTVIMLADHYTTLYYTTLQITTIHCAKVHGRSLKYTTVHYSTLQYTTLHFNTLQYTTVHCSTLQYTSVHWGQTKLFIAVFCHASQCM